MRARVWVWVRVCVCVWRGVECVAIFENVNVNCHPLLFSCTSNITTVLSPRSTVWHRNARCAVAEGGPRSTSVVPYDQGPVPCATGQCRHSDRTSVAARCGMALTDCPTVLYMCQARALKPWLLKNLLPVSLITGVCLGAAWPTPGVAVGTKVDGTSPVQVLSVSLSVRRLCVRVRSVWFG
jgi:hypothetical protein